MTRLAVAAPTPRIVGMSAGTGIETAPVPPHENSRRAQRRRERGQARSKRRLSVVGVFGELLITAGVVVLLYIGWQLWFTEITVGHELKNEAAQQSELWNQQASSSPPPTAPVEVPTDVPTSDPDEGDAGDPATDAPPVSSVAFNPPVQEPPADATFFGSLIVPRWGAEYYRPIYEGTSVAEVLDRGRLGRYTNTSMPGAIGNFALAAHRMGRGGSLHHIHELQLGDAIYVETASGWYKYEFRNLEYVSPRGIGVLNPVPQAPEVPATERYITLTSCNPQYTSIERIIAYGVFDQFYPRDTSLPNNGAPDEIAATAGGGA